MSKGVDDFLKADRRDFNDIGIDPSSMLTDPLEQFREWLQEAIEKEVQEPYAMCLSTYGLNDFPASRIVFLRELKDQGLIFYTNYSSQKGIEMEQNNKAALNFHWEKMDRQVRVNGLVQKASSEISDAYFASRPRGSQIGAWASAQSQEIQGRQEIEQKVNEMELKFEGKEVPRPEHWGGYVLIPREWEFWQGRSSRLHDRISYRKEGGSWTMHRLNP